MRIPARFHNLGDIVPMPLPDEFSPDYIAPVVPPQVPTLPLDAATDFYTTYNQANTVPGYVGGVPQSDSIAPGSFYTPALPNGGLPYTPFNRPGQRSNPFFHTPIVPDSSLPPALKRQSQILDAAVHLFVPNGWDNAIARENALWTWIRAHGGLKSCCRIPELGAPIWSIPPFIQMPSNGVVERQIFSQPLTAFQTAGSFNGIDTIIGQWQVPKGYDGAITHFLALFTGDGFDDGSGEIIWRLKIGQRYAKNLGNVTFTYGDLNTALLVEGQSIRLISGQTVSLIANIPSTSFVSGGRVFGGTLGWTYPRR
jgi:hypothetical protein